MRSLKASGTHLTPIAEGQRKTRLDDLTVLCANCHRLAHSEQPPVPLDRLRALADLQAGRANQPAANTKRLSLNQSG